MPTSFETCSLGAPASQVDNVPSLALLSYEGPQVVGAVNADAYKQKVLPGTAFGATCTVALKGSAALQLNKYPSKTGIKHFIKPSVQPAPKKVAIKVLRGLLRPQQKTAFDQSSARASSPISHRTGVKRVLKFYGAKYIKNGEYDTIAEAAAKFVQTHALEDTTFYVYNLGEIYRLYTTWRTTLPRVTPFYAVKCNPDPGILSMLFAMGAGFDCASVQELERVLAMGVPQSRIIFANPCKKMMDFAYANRKGVEFTTFDCVSELEKIKEHRPDFKCVLRVRCDDNTAHINLGLKYGAEREDIPMLLQVAKEFGLTVSGVSFHVGSGCKNPAVYESAIETARYAFDIGKEMGFQMKLLDIGGGYTSPSSAHTRHLFYATAAVINSSLDTYFPLKMGVRVISEPGQYFAETTATLFTSVLGHKSNSNALGEVKSMEYWLSDGCFGSFRIPVIVDGLQLNSRAMRSPLLPEPTAEELRLLPSKLWGPSPDPSDCVHRGFDLPLLRNGDWLAWHHAGAYTVAAAGNFAGMRFVAPHKLYVFAKDSVQGRALADDLQLSD